MRAHSIEQQPNFCSVIKLHVYVRQILHGRPRMLTRDLFAVVNLRVTTAGQVNEGPRRCNR